MSKAGLKPGLLLLDRGFYSVAVIRYLQRARWACSSHASCLPRPQGRSSQRPQRVERLQAGEEERGGSATPSRTARRTRPRSWIVREAVRWVDRHGRRKSDTWVYAYWGITPRRVDWVKETYRKRFGIETSYRQMNQCRIRTTTKKFNVRFLYVAIGLLLRNLWVWLHHFVLSSPRRGGRRYNWDLLRVEGMLRSAGSVWPKRCMDWSTQ